MPRVVRVPATLQRDRTSTTETGESREVDIEVEPGRVAFILRDANALAAGVSRVVGPFHRLEVDEADLRWVLGADY